MLESEATVSNKELQREKIRERYKGSNSELLEVIPGKKAADYCDDIETGKSKASLETIVNIANALNVTVDRLLFGNVQNSGDCSSELRELFSDCSTYEKSVIFDTANSIKKSLRMNKELLFKRKSR